MPSRYGDYELYPDSAVIYDGELVHFAPLVYTKPIDHTEATKAQVWKAALIEELKAIERKLNLGVSKIAPR